LRDRRQGSELQSEPYLRSRRRQSSTSKFPFVLKWRMVIPVVVAIVLIGTALWPQSKVPAGVGGQPGDQSASETSASATQPPRPSAQGTNSQSTQVATANTIRPLSGPEMPRVVDTGPAPVRKAGTPDPDPSTEHVIVVDGTSGATLFQRNAQEPIAPASLTKIMTAILGIEHGKISDRVKVDVNARDFADSTVMGLAPGFDVTLEDILYGLMLPSGNDAATQIAHYVGGTEGAFVGLMNEKASWLGLKATHFVNPHGLDAPDHYSNPYDMVVMARYGMQYPVFQTLAAAKRYDIRESNISYTITNLNPMLGTYVGADGVKIGYTDNSGRAIVASATRNGHRVYVAFMKATNGLAPETAALLDWAFGSFSWPQ
jgi:D-alanyl-D-alanine carboxypeptidase